MSEAIISPIDASTRYCAVLGHPIQHSASPAMQNAGVAALGLNWRYLAFDVRPEQLPAAISGAQALHFLGLNLTIPHKILALDLVQVLDASATAWGAVNTIRFEGLHPDGDWRALAEFKQALPIETRSHGFNTDADALSRSLREDLQLKLKGDRVLLLGAGGAGQAAALKLAAEGVAQLFLINRTRSKAEGVAVAVKKQFPAVDVRVGYPAAPVDLLLNATSLGLNPNDALPLELTQFPLNQARAVDHMIYQPAQTPLLQAARNAGCRTASGLGMLLYQGAKALELWCGRAAPTHVMRAALENHLYGP